MPEVSPHCVDLQLTRFTQTARVVLFSAKPLYRHTVHYMLSNKQQTDTVRLAGECSGGRNLTQQLVVRKKRERLNIGLSGLQKNFFFFFNKAHKETQD